MATKLIIDGNAVYEIDEEYEEYQRQRNGMKNQRRYTKCGSIPMVSGSFSEEEC